MTGRPMLRLLILAVLMAACAPAPSTPPAPSPTAAPTASSVPATPTPWPSQDAATTYRAIAAQVVAIRGLTPTGDVVPQVIDRATLQQNLAIEFDKDNPPADIARTEAIEKALGLVPAAASLRNLYVKLQGSQVIGYYDPTAKKLFIVTQDGGLGPTGRLTYAHEFTHQLQDQRFDLSRLGLDKLHDDSDRALAIQSLVEGDAVSVQTAWMLANLTATELGQVAAEASDPSMLAILASMPPVLLETSLFPYQAGASFVASLRSAGNAGYPGVDAAFAKPPASTAQILHPEKYVAGEGPVAVTLPNDLAARFGAGWTVSATDTLGELQARVWLKGGGVAGDVARAAADGWGGDRLVLVKGSDGTSSILVYASAWDTAADADGFDAAATTALAGLRLDGAIAQNGNRVVVGIRSGAAPAGAALEAILRGLAASSAS
ncbi:MAG: hypothetical protein HY264_04125 [Chloroflexi bacterium]|nr:hypothetical protein [Chloroflexota bacterium]